MDSDEAEQVARFFRVSVPRFLPAAQSRCVWGAVIGVDYGLGQGAGGAVNCDGCRQGRCLTEGQKQRQGRERAFPLPL
jgi:hypothetical protein